MTIHAFTYGLYVALNCAWSCWQWWPWGTQLLNIGH